MTALVILALLAADGGSALSLADVKVGDLVEYQLDGRATLTLRACARSQSTLTIAVWLTSTQKRNWTALIDGVLIDQPLAPLTPPPELRQPTAISTWRAGGGVWQTCGLWKRPFSMHGNNGETRRCEAQELILGGGLVSSTDSVFTIRGGGYNHEVTLKRFGNTVTPCPSWPHAKVSGWYRMVEDSGPWVQVAESRADERVSIDHTIVSSGSWVRLTEGGSQPNEFYLVDLLVSLARRRLDAAGTATPSSVAAEARKIDAWQEQSYTDGGWFYENTVTRWAKPEALADAPLELRGRPLTWEYHSEMERQWRDGYERATAWGLGAAPKAPAPDGGR